jgi:hypothetical protein
VTLAMTCVAVLVAIVVGLSLVILYLDGVEDRDRDPW